MGFTFTAPTDFLGLYGLAEGILYANRLYGLIIDHFGDAEIKDAHRERFHRAESVIGSGYDDDLLMRHLLHMMDDLYQAEQAIHQLYGESVAFENFQKLCTMHFEPSLDAVTTSGIVSSDKLFVSAEIGNTTTLNNGVKMPLVGLGTWQLEGEKCTDAVYLAISKGYRHIDTAEAYRCRICFFNVKSFTCLSRNEAEVGTGIARAISEGIVTREELFIATKLSDESNAGYDRVMKKVLSQLEDLRLEYLDLYMLHSPIEDASLQHDTWRGLETLYRSGKIKALGVSNFDEHRLRVLIENCEVPPAVVQNKLDIYHVGKQLDNHGDGIVSYARSKGIVVVAYSSLSAYPFSMLPAYDPIVNFVASRQPTPTTSAQVLLRWTLQLGGTAIIPRSSHGERLEENLQVLDMQPLSEADMALLNTLQYLVASPISVPV